MTHITSLPEVILQVICESWLSMQELAFLDVAFSCHTSRSMFLGTLQQTSLDAQSIFTYMDEVEQVPKWFKDATLFSCLNWLVARKCKLRQPLKISASLTSHAFVSKLVSGSTEHVIDGVRIGIYDGMVDSLYFYAGRQALPAFAEVDCLDTSSLDNVILLRLNFALKIFPSLARIILLDVDLFFGRALGRILESIASTNASVMMPNMEVLFLHSKTLIDPSSLFINHLDRFSVYENFDVFTHMSFTGDIEAEEARPFVSRIKHLRFVKKCGFDIDSACLVRAKSLQSLHFPSCPLPIVTKLLAELPDLKEVIHKSFYCNLALPQPVLTIDEFYDDRQHQQLQALVAVLPPIHTLKLPSHDKALETYDQTHLPPLASIFETQFLHVRRLEIDRTLWTHFPDIVSGLVCLEEFVCVSGRSIGRHNRVTADNRYTALLALSSCAATLRTVNLEAYGGTMMEKEVICLVRALPGLTSLACRLSKAANTSLLLTALQGKVWEYLGLCFLPLKDIVYAVESLGLAFKKIKFCDTSVDFSGKTASCLGHGRVPIPLSSLKEELMRLEKLREETRQLRDAQAQEAVDLRLKGDMEKFREQRLWQRRVMLHD
eukprot:gene34629-41934_t